MSVVLTAGMVYVTRPVCLQSSWLWHRVYDRIGYWHDFTLYISHREPIPLSANDGCESNQVQGCLHHTVSSTMLAHGGILRHWEPKVVIKPTLSSLASPSVINLRCRQWLRSWHHENSRVSVRQYAFTQYLYLLLISAWTPSAICFVFILLWC